MPSIQQTRREMLKAAGLGLASLAMPSCAAAAGRNDGPPPRKPNFIVILADDQGYQDMGCFGSPDIVTPNLDRLAGQGMRFTSFYSAAPVCTPSRAALMTGCYPMRVSLPRVLFPLSDIGISAGEKTIAEYLKPLGYATACVGKWHLGHHPEFLPTRHGFDEYFGLPYSNDMLPDKLQKRIYPELPLIEGGKVIERNPDQAQLTTRYTERACAFIRANKDRPFFLYLPHTMPHVPLHVSDKFKGKSKRGLYGDVIMEIDWSVGRIAATLEELGLERDTLVFYSSDNGPWLIQGADGGSALPLREGKGTTFDGGQREPTIMRWPGVIPSGSSCNEMCAMFDVLPTIVGLAGGIIDKDRVIDGRDIAPLMKGQAGAATPHEAFYFYSAEELQAARSGRWKLHLPHQYRSVEKDASGPNGVRTSQKQIGPALFDIEADVGERTDLASANPDVVEKLTAMARQFDADLKAGARPPGRVSAVQE
ncbi:MAG TPA: sulfatase [Candidatus Brocadiia bacterium]|nr:sulfatase [Candidatus Brocadiia bacterium]